MENNFHLLQSLDRSVYEEVLNILRQHPYLRIMSVIADTTQDDWIGDMLQEDYYEVYYTTADLWKPAAEYDAVLCMGTHQRLSIEASEKLSKDAEAAVRPGGHVIITMSAQSYTDRDCLWLADGKKLGDYYKTRKDYRAQTIHHACKNNLVGSNKREYSNEPDVWMIDYTV